MAAVEKQCRCGQTFTARSADIARGWGMFCSKRCKANDQEKVSRGQYARIKRASYGPGAQFNAKGEFTHYASPFSTTRLF